METRYYEARSLIERNLVPVPVSCDPRDFVDYVMGDFSKSRVFRRYSEDGDVSCAVRDLKNAISCEDEGMIERSQDILYLQVCKRYIKMNCNCGDGSIDVRRVIDSVLERISKLGVVKGN
ncbi:hypothetical protein GOV12_07045 [Candidatus Pacearchaeota archaeon]|nr:hypothetical protein [Candidatus Pacearchaeota archaeon]